MCRSSTRNLVLGLDISAKRTVFCIVKMGSVAWWEGAEKARVLVAPDLGCGGKNPGQLLTLRHPKSGNGTCYLFNNETLQELQWFKQSYGSWFLGDYISEDGSLYMATPVDPVFILLPIFEEARMKKGEDPGKFRQLDDIIFVEGYPGYQDLLSLAETCMEIVCETQDVGGTKFYRLDDYKVLAWLKCKVCRLKQTLSALDKNYAAQDEKNTLVDAVSIVGEYLKTEPWLKLLYDHLGLDFFEATKKETNVENSLETPDSLEEKKTDKKSGKTGKQTKQAKVETASRNIREMFSRACKKRP